MHNEMTTAGLSPDQIASFEENGFLALDTLLTDGELQPLEKDYAQLLEQVAGRLHQAGAVSDTFAHLPFGERFSRLIELYPDLHRFFNVSLPLINGKVDPETYHMHASPAVFNLMRNRRILDVVESLIGPEIYSSPVQQMRMKPPEKILAGDLKNHSNVGATTWHQDIVALLPEADDTRQLTVWVAITEATVENGCLISVPGSHREGPMAHCSNAAIASEPSVPDALLREREAVPLPVQRGGIVLFDKMNVHRALPNRSDKLRWSLDLRYHPTGQATGRPAFPGFIARSRAQPESELRDAARWTRNWDEAREAIAKGAYQGRIFEDRRWNDAAVC
jgi:hypothetical protein